MEMICKWNWRPAHNGPQQEDAFGYEPESGRVWIYRRGAKTKDYYDGAWLLAMLSRKNYDTLKPNMQKAYDFLKTKIGAK